mgnify:CR=1 FL=1
MKTLVFVGIRVRNEIIMRGKAIYGSFNYLRAIIALAQNMLLKFIAIKSL